MDDPILLSARVPLGDAKDAARLAVYLVRGDEVLASAPIDEKGGLRVELQTGELEQPSAYGLALVVGPAGFEDHLENVGSLQRVPLERELIAKARKGRLDLGALELDLSEARLELWWRWCWPYEVSGVLLTPDGCPVPGADVTVYSVRHTIFGYGRTARATVTTDATGHFTASFNWCRCFCCCSCWPCWPFWWYCWPWWWERDILHVIESIEQTLAVGGRLREQAPQLAVARPRFEELVRGEAFTASKVDASPLVQDEERTQLVRRELSSPAIRELFPWWWWCCDEPSIVFSAVQGTVTVLDENPATQTRWCLPSGSFETLVASSSAVGLCGGGTGPVHGFVFEEVGRIDVGDIHDGYADGGAGSPESDMAFTGSLDIFGQFASTSGVDYYQVVAGQWSGNPARGGTAPSGGSTIGPDLYARALILRADNTWVPPFAVKMGPFDQGGQTNLYATQATRLALAPGAIPLPDLPAMGPGDELFWIDANLVVSTAAQALINGNAEGAVTLSVRGYDGAFASIALAANPDDHLTLEIDTTPITVAHIDTFDAFDSSGNTVLSTTAGDCRAYHLAGGHVALGVTVRDENGHLADYSLTVDYGHGSAASASPGERSYPQNPLTFPPSPYSAPDQAQKAFVGGSETYTYVPPVECCYDFRLNVEKRVTNGYGSPGVYTADFWTASLVP